jgi:hypothetical protein
LDLIKHITTGNEKQHKWLKIQGKNERDRRTLARDKLGSNTVTGEIRDHYVVDRMRHDVV